MNDAVITFSPILPMEAPAVSEMSLRIWRQHYLPDILSEGELDYLWQRAYTPEILQAHIEKGACYEWIKVDGQPAGFLAYSILADEKCLHLSKLYLDPECHGCGIGNRALLRVRQRAVSEGLREITLYVFRNNQKAIRAYSRAGFVVDRAEMTECGNGYRYDDFVMVCRVNPEEASPR